MVVNIPLDGASFKVDKDYLYLDLGNGVRLVIEGDVDALQMISGARLLEVRIQMRMESIDAHPKPTSIQ